MKHIGYHTANDADTTPHGCIAPLIEVKTETSVRTQAQMAQGRAINRLSNTRVSIFYTALQELYSSLPTYDMKMLFRYSPFNQKYSNRYYY